VTPVTFTRDRVGSSGNPCVRIYACWSRQGPPICLARGSANGGGPPLAIVVCSSLLLPLFRTTLNSFICPASSAKHSLPFSNDQAARAFHQPSHSASAVDARTESKVDITIVETVTIPKPSVFCPFPSGISINLSVTQTFSYTGSHR
jgi:hypothetical protein